MRILFDIGHPGHVHFFKHAIQHLQNSGHEISISARDKDVTLDLLESYGFPYRMLSGMGNGKWSLYREFIEREFALFNLIREVKPDVVTAIGGVFIAPVCKVLRVPSLVFTDTEHVAIDRWLTNPFASKICTPACFLKDLGERQIRYKGYHEIAYLDPRYFQPDRQIVNDLGIDENERFFILRFVAWNASHDVGHYGFSNTLKQKSVEILGQYGRVFISSEAKLPAEFEPFRLTVPSHKMHHVIAFADLYIGEGATMATEAGVLGTPSVYVSSLVGTMGNFVELEQQQLVYSFSRAEQALEYAMELIQDTESKEQWMQRRNNMLSQNIDVTQFVIQQIETASSLS
ncbi:MAG: DUF354 domain-containing protein [Chloroflexota bacterium]